MIRESHVDKAMKRFETNLKDLFALSYGDNDSFELQLGDNDEGVVDFMECIARTYFCLFIYLLIRAGANT